MLDEREGNIPETYRGWRIMQGPDDLFRVDAPAEAATWEELREEIDAWVASGDADAT